jgi:hypothetical protein
MRSYLLFFAEKGLETWIAHGTLLGWWWNGQVRHLRLFIFILDFAVRVAGSVRVPSLLLYQKQGM